jgi:hypothetical protein
LAGLQPGFQYSGGWTKSSISQPYSGTGVANVPELPVTAQETEAAGASVTVLFRGTGINWIGYRGPDAGIARCASSATPRARSNLYSTTATYQPIVFTATGLPDVVHAVTITATGRKNGASSAARRRSRRARCLHSRTALRGIPSLDRLRRQVVDAPQRRAVWSEGATATSNERGATATLQLHGDVGQLDRVREGERGGMADVFIDNVYQTRGAAQPELSDRGIPDDGVQEGWTGARAAYAHRSRWSTPMGPTSWWMRST